MKTKFLSALCVLVLSFSFASFAQVTIDCPADTVINATGCPYFGDGIDVSLSLNASSPCGLTSFSGNHDFGSGYPFAFGTTLVIYTFNDSCGNSATCSFNVTVNLPPRTITITCADTTVSAQDCDGATVNFSATAFSASSIDNIQYSPFDRFDHLPIGTTTIKAVATDYCGDQDSCTFTVTVLPPSPPEIICSGDIVRQANLPNCTAEITYHFQKIDAFNIYQDIVVTSTYPVGTIPIQIPSFTDACGTSSNSCTINITVTAPPAPEILCSGNVTTQADLPGCFGEATYSFQRFSSFQTYQEIIETTTYPLGTTTIEIPSFTDACGTPSNSCSINITVIPSTPHITCPSNITAAATSCLGAIVSFNATPSSDVGIDHTDYGAHPPGSLFPVGTTTVTATTYDNCGGSSSCTFDVTVTPFLSVSAGADVSTIFGYASTQTATRTATVTGGTGPYTYLWTLSRPLKCNQVNNTGDELFTGGTCSNNNCPTSGSATAAAPTCSGNATINATLIADADVCVTVTDATGCTGSDCFHITAIDGRCFTGNAGKNKAKICHQTGSASNPFVTICIAKNVANNFIANHPGDFLGPCSSRIDEQYTEDEETLLSSSPNPFSTNTTIQFMLPDNDFATVTVTDVTGRQIEKLFDGETEAANVNEIIFDGSKYSNGIYFLVLRSGNGILETRKLMLDK